MKRVFLFILISIVPFFLYSQDILNQSEGNGGYKGFVEAGYAVGIGEVSIDRLELMTSHGYAFNSCFYLGIGAGVEYYNKAEATAIPVFLDIRASLLERNVSPSLGMKIGYSFDDVEGFYLSPTIGIKVNSFHFGVGYVMQFVNFEDYDMMNEGISFKLSYCF